MVSHQGSTRFVTRFLALQGRRVASRRCIRDLTTVHDQTLRQTRRMDHGSRLPVTPFHAFFSIECAKLLLPVGITRAEDGIRQRSPKPAYQPSLALVSFVEYLASAAAPSSVPLPGAPCLR